MNERHMTRTDLCRKSRLPESTLRGILNGEAYIPHCRYSTISALANALDTTAEEILRDASEHERDMRFGAEDYADQIFGGLEDTLNKLLNIELKMMIKFH